MPNDALSYAEIRQLRGARTRATFAAALGVDPQTVYRWELPPGSPQARRPRGQVLQRLRAFADGEARPVSRTEPAQPGRVPPEAARVASELTAVGDDATLAITAAIQHVLDGDWREAEAVFLRAVSDRNASTLAQLLAATGLGCIEVLYRGDGRRALAMLAPVWSSSAPPFALAEAVAALAYAFPDGVLFDVGRVHDHAGRAKQLARSESPVAVALAVAAEANAAMVSGDDDLMFHALAHLDAVAVGSLPEVPNMMIEQLRAFAAVRTGQGKAAGERLERLLAHPRLSVAPPIEARALAMSAIGSLDRLGDPVQALALARRSRAVIEAAKLPLGVHTAVMLRCEGEALCRLGRLTEAGRVFAEGDRILLDDRFPATVLLIAQIRYLLITGQADELDERARRLAAIELPSVRGVSQAMSAWCTATAHLARGDDAETIAAAFSRAERLSERWWPLRRDVLLAHCSAILVSADPATARPIFVRAQRAVERAPTAWISAQLRRVEGNLLAIEGRLDESKVVFEAAAAMFEASGDRMDAALIRFGAANLRARLGEAGAGERVEAAEAALAAIGAPKPIWILRACERAVAAMAARAVAIGHAAAPPRDEVFAPGDGVALEVALQRLAMTGATTAVIERELIATASDLSGATAVLATGNDASASAPADMTWFDIGGFGSSRRLGVAAQLADPVRTRLRILALVAGLALEAAELRTGDPVAGAPPEMPEIPGLIAASPAMRQVLGDVARLAPSHATVIISGESGVGKELIARALHQRSARADKPYIAFNCAAIPHELFEGQLFGHMKGAFTGAATDQLGVIRAADGGTLFLDEIGELPLDIQPKLLRFLDNAEVFPLGARRPITVDVRVVAATNRDLAAEVRRGRFREDLYYRLLVVPVTVPPLRARRDDIVPLARHFVRLVTAQDASAGRPAVFAPDALAALVEHSWPGNVRELRNAIARALAYSPRPSVITRAQLGL